MTCTYGLKEMPARRWENPIFVFAFFMFIDVRINIPLLQHSEESSSKLLNVNSLACGEES